MIIHQPETRRENGKYIVTARIEYDQDANLPSELWFRVDEEFASHVSIRAEAFVTSLIRIAREIHEDIEIHGDFSPQLLFGLKEYQYIQASWFKNNRRIKIKANSLVPSPPIDGERVASCNISGGIDSAYTLWSLLPENQPIPDFQIKFGIFGEALSFPGIDLQNSRSYGSKLKSLVNSVDIELLIVGSNLPLFKVNKSAWIALSSGRTAIPLLFSPLITTHFVPSTDSYEELKPWPNHPMLDHLYSTETLRYFTHASNVNRWQKLQEISNWAPVHEFLQVCNKAEKDEINCCRCNKCYRTMIAVDILGVEEKFKSFHLPLRKIDLLRNNIFMYSLYRQYKMMAKLAWSLGKRGVIPFLYFSILKYLIYRWAKRLIDSRVGKLFVRKKIGFFN